MYIHVQEFKNACSHGPCGPTKVLEILQWWCFAFVLGGWIIRWFGRVFHGNTEHVTELECTLDVGTKTEENGPMQSHATTFWIPTTCVLQRLPVHILIAFVVSRPQGSSRSQAKARLGGLAHELSAPRMVGSVWPSWSMILIRCRKLSSPDHQFSSHYHGKALEASSAIRSDNDFMGKVVVASMDSTIWLPAFDPNDFFSEFSLVIFLNGCRMLQSCRCRISAKLGSQSRSQKPLNDFWKPYSRPSVTPGARMWSSSPRRRPLWRWLWIRGNGRHWPTIGCLRFCHLPAGPSWHPELQRLRWHAGNGCPLCRKPNHNHFKTMWLWNA